LKLGRRKDGAASSVPQEVQVVNDGAPNDSITRDSAEVNHVVSFDSPRSSRCSGAAQSDGSAHPDGERAGQNVFVVVTIVVWCGLALLLLLRRRRLRLGTRRWPTSW